jgi:hypothetical protein
LEIETRETQPWTGPESKIENQKSKIKNQKSKIKNQKSRIGNLRR